MKIMYPCVCIVVLELCAPLCIDAYRPRPDIYNGFEAFNSISMDSIPFGMCNLSVYGFFLHTIFTGPFVYDVTW